MQTEIERKLAFNAYKMGQSIPTILDYLYNWNDIMEYDELEVELFYLTKEELEYVLNKHFNNDIFINETCKLINNKPINELDFDKLIPDSIKVAVRDAFNEGYTPFGMTYDWEAQNHFDFSFDYLVNDYLIESDAKEFVKRINNIYIYASKSQ